MTALSMIVDVLELIFLPSQWPSQGSLSKQRLGVQACHMTLGDAIHSELLSLDQH
jgi:hypothetical protein